MRADRFAFESIGTFKHSSTFCTFRRLQWSQCRGFGNDEMIYKLKITKSPIIKNWTNKRSKQRMVLLSGFWPMKRGD